jgi:hypothetical protein
MKSISLCALPIILTLAAVPPAAFAQSRVCYAVQSGDTASRLAQRITGDARNKYQPWFQIVDASMRSVPQSQYDRIRPGWRACILKEPVEGRTAPADDAVAEELTTPVEAATPVKAATPVEAAAGLPPAAIVPRAIRDVDLSMVWLGAVVVVPLLGWRILDGYYSRRKAALIVMRHFAHRFLREFERPLVQPHAAEHAVKSQLRLSLHRARFDILLAPAEGRRYPNLSDHRKNVEYDVARVLHVLGDKSFVCGQLSVQAEWVVVPFLFRVGPKQPGVVCTSSF